MQKEKIQQFTLRITQSNRTELIAIMYEMMDVYFADAAEAKEKDDYESFKKNVKNADRVIKELQDILDFKYEISNNLYSLYTFCRKQLSMSIVKYNTKGIEEAKKVLTGLGAAFHELAKKDASAPMMQNTQKVAYGATYGKTDIMQDTSADINRGYFA